MTKQDPSVQAIITATDQAAKVVADAANTARGVVEKATLVASDLASKNKDENEQTTRTLEIALRNVFGEFEESKRFVDVTRIPLICQAIVDMHGNIEKINNNITWAVRIVIGAVIIAVLTLVFKH